MSDAKSVSKAQRLRDLAENCEQIAEGAVRVDEALTRARADVLSLAMAARRIADRLNQAGDGEAVELSTA